MKKIQILGVALLALFALSAMVASLASAETTLLAEWLSAGASIGAAVASKSTGTITLEDTKLGIGVLCTGSFDGTVGPNGADTVTEVLNAGGTKIELAGTLLTCEAHKFCESGTDLFAAAEKLPFKTLLYLTEGGLFLDAFFNAGYFTECLVLGVKVSETCEAPVTAGEVKNVTGGVEAVGAPAPKANCETGGKEAGIIEFSAGNLTTLNSGLALTVSE